MTWVLPFRLSRANPLFFLNEEGIKGGYLPRSHPFGNFFHILPHLSLPLGIPQEKGGMIGWDYRDPREVVDFPAEGCDLRLGLKQSLGGKST